MKNTQTPFSHNNRGGHHHRLKVSSHDNHILCNTKSSSSYMCLWKPWQSVPKPEAIASMASGDG